MSGVQPDALGKYAVRGTLGRGAMGTVYDGWDPAIDRRVAIKTVRLPEAHDQESQEGLARFKREAQAAGRLNHPNIVGVFDYGETNEVAFIVMEFVEGRTLKDLLEGEARLSLADAASLVRDVLTGLAYSHERGVVHRDIKPANIMITQGSRAKIADFGIARIESSSMTQAGTVMGTPAYMSPEQFMGQTVDRRTDIYSSGVLLYQLLTGERPFEGSLTSIMHKALNTVPPRPSELSVTAPVGLDAVIGRAMARRPEDRYDTADAFAQAIDQALAPAAPQPAAGADATIVARPSAPAPAVARTPLPPSAAAKGRIVAAALAALLAIAGGGAWFGLSRPSRPAASTTPESGPELQPSRPTEAQPATGQAPLALQAAVPALPSSTAFAPPQTQPVTTPPLPPVDAALTPPSPAPPPAPAALPGLTGPEPQPPAPQALALVTAPTPSPASPPAPSPPASPLHSPPPARSVAMVASALAGSLPGLGCTLAHAAVSPEGKVTVTGLAGRGTADAALFEAVTAAHPQLIDWHVTGFGGPYCPALDLLRTVPDPAGRAGLDMAQADGPATLPDNAVIAIDVTMPGFGGYLHLVYLQHDGTAAPLVPGAGYPARTYAAGAKVAFGRPREGFEGWHVGPPFGTDMIVAIASSAPLFSVAPPNQQPLAAYLRSLQTAMDTLRRHGGSLAVNALVLETQAGG